MHFGDNESAITYVYKNSNKHQNFGACKNEVRTQIKLGLVQLSILN